MMNRDTFESPGRGVFAGGSVSCAPSESTLGTWSYRSQVLECLSLTFATWAVVFGTALTIMKTLHHLAA